MKLYWKIIVFVSAVLVAICHSCKKEKEPTSPILTTATVSEITQTGAVSGGNVTNDGGSEVSARGVCWGTAQNPTTGTTETVDGTGTGAFTSNITGLAANSTYHVRAYATNSVGTAYGKDVLFSTSPIVLATLTTQSVSYITIVSARVDAVISDYGGSSLTATGVCWDINPNPTTALSTNTKSVDIGGFTFTADIMRLKPSITYYVRAYAINSAGTAYGNELSFTTKTLISEIGFNPDLTYGSVSDIEGNIYKTITIGTQTWMAENLKATKYNTGDLIGTTTPDSLNLAGETNPKYQWAYNGDESLVPTYGRLYTWYAVNDSRNVCPSGWHVPTVTEWTILTDFLGEDYLAGSKLKETGFTHWFEWTDSYTEATTNESGFTAIPGGSRDNCCSYYGLGYTGIWWSSSQAEGYVDVAWGRSLQYGSSGITIQGEYEKSAFSVRCVKD